MGHNYKLTATVLLLTVYLCQCFSVELERAVVSPKAPNFDADFLAAHNNYRKKHQVGPLAYDSTLTAQAQKWADNLAATNTFQHSTSGYGENMYAAWSSVQGFQVAGATPVNSWYKEISNYNFPTGTSSTGGVIGHFTQAVWKSSQKLGVGVARSATTNKVYVVANYSPPGNYVGQYPANVFPAL